MSEQIEGVPEGWRLVAIRRVKNGEWFIGVQGRIEQWSGMVGDESRSVYGVVEKIEQPKQFRPFKNAAEFEPHRDRWWRLKEESDCCQRTTYYSEDSNSGQDWETSFDERVFDDGSPFGVEVTE